MSTDSIPVGLRSLLAKHYFLAQISQGYKPCMSNMTLVESTSWYGSFYRFWYGESRKTVISEIEDIIGQTIDAIVAHKSKTSFLKLIINALASTRVGIESMKNTYRGDPAMIGKLQVQLTNIDLQLEEHRHLITGYAHHDEKIVNEVVETAETSDKEGFKNFLMGNSVPFQGSQGSKEVTKEIITETKEIIENPKDISQGNKDQQSKDLQSANVKSTNATLESHFNNVAPVGNTVKSLLSEAEERRRRRRQVKLTEETDKAE